MECDGSLFHACRPAIAKEQSGLQMMRACVALRQSCRPAIAKEQSGLQMMRACVALRQSSTQHLRPALALAAADGVMRSTK